MTTPEQRLEDAKWLESLADDLWTSEPQTTLNLLGYHRLLRIVKDFENSVPFDVVAKLLRYPRHNPSCSLYHSVYGPCKCGLSEVVDELESYRRKE